MTEITLPISGMHCGGCVSSVKSVLSALPGVDRVEVTLDPGQAIVSYDESRVDRAALVQAVGEAGFEVVS
ncbi:MAG: heavy-metal-associated domain-containing protein [Thiobacillus sp.]|jgi:copper chaperone